MQDEIIDQLHTIKDFIRYATSCFEQAGVYCGHGTDNVFDEAIAMTLSLLRLPRTFNVAVWDARLVREEKVRLLKAIQQRTQERYPLAYITREAWFADLKFYVDERVIIPRSPFAELIQKGFEPWVSIDQPIERMLDLCCGSGCIAIALAHYFPGAKVNAVDIDTGAIEITQLNVKNHQIEDYVDVVQSDLFAGVTGRTYDLIVSNPPYVDAHDMATLPPEFRQEPRLALAAGDDGLRVVRRILREARRYLNDSGVLFVEVGNSQEALKELYPDVHFSWIDFEHGGDGVFMLTAADLDQHADVFERAWSSRGQRYS